MSELSRASLRSLPPVPGCIFCPQTPVSRIDLTDEPKRTDSRLALGYKGLAADIKQVYRDKGCRAMRMPTIEETKRAPRIFASLTVALSEGEAHYVLDTSNLSGTGLCLHPKKEFPVGTELHLVFGQPPELPGMSVQGIVRWSEGEKGVGVEFTTISAGDHQALLRFVSSTSLREPAWAIAPSYI